MLNTALFLLKKLNHRSTNTGLGTTTRAPRGGDITDNKREVRAGRRQGSRPSGHAFFGFAGDSDVTPGANLASYYAEGGVTIVTYALIKVLIYICFLIFI